MIAIGENNYSKGTRKVTHVNPDDADWTRHTYLMMHGDNSSVCALVWANSIDDAIEVVGEWMHDNAPGLYDEDAHHNLGDYMQDPPASYLARLTGVAT